MLVILGTVVFMPEGASAAVKIDETNFPDELLRNEVSKRWDSDKDGVLSDAEGNKANVLFLESDKLYTVTSLKGVSYLPNIGIIYCESVKITENLLSYFPNLWDLTISNSSVKIKGNTEKLSCLYLYSPIKDADSVIDIQANNLIDLQIQTAQLPNVCKIKASNLRWLDIKATKKTDLSGIQCISNKLEELKYCNPDVTKFPLDLSVCSKLKTLDCSESDNLKSINLKGLKNLKHLMISDCNFKTLNLSGLKNLDYLDCPNNNIKSLNLKKCKKLTRLDISYNPIKKLNLTKNKKLTDLVYCGVKMKKLDLSKNTKISSLGVMNSKIITLILPKIKNRIRRTWDMTEFDEAPRKYDAKINTLDLSKLKSLKHLKGTYNITLKNDFCKKKYSLKKIVINKKLKKADKKYIKKLAKKCKAKVVVKK